MNAVSDIAFYCCGVRMEDAERSFSICNDRFARRFMDARGLEIYRPFRSELMANLNIATRCRIIDDMLRDGIDRDQGLQVVNIGAGFDTRPYRIDGGIWIELDEADIMDFKDERLPVVECPNPLKRISIDFATEGLADKLHGLRQDRPVMVVIEGVLMYLTPEAIDTMLDSLFARLGSHQLVCDLMNRRCFDRFGGSVHAKLVALGARFTERPDRPETPFLAHGYRAVETVSISKRALQLGALRHVAGIPNLVAQLMLSLFVTDLDGYRVLRFERDAAQVSGST